MGLKIIVLGKSLYINKPADPVKEGFTFKCWVYQNEPWSFIGSTVTFDMTLVATYE